MVKIHKWWLDLFQDETLKMNFMYSDNCQWQTGHEQQQDEILNIRIEYVMESNVWKDHRSLFV